MTSLPLINQAYEKIKENGSLTDEELSKSLAKSGIVGIIERHVFLSHDSSR
jgi:hypothetical protein